MMWKLQHFFWKLIPGDQEANHSTLIFGFIIVLGLVIFAIGYLLKRRWLSRSGLVLTVLTPLVWVGMYVTRPAWLRIAAQPVVPNPECSAPHWESRMPGLETAELELRVGSDVVDRMVLTRLDPKRFRFSVHWDPKGSKLAEDWQKELNAAVVVNGSYFGHGFEPLTPLRLSGTPAGPTQYQSGHGAFVANGDHVEILDLKNREVFPAINAFPEAIVSYPLLLDAQGVNRAPDTRVWLASRNFVGIDQENHVILGTTETGFFTLYRLGEFLKTSPLHLRMALNFDGGPLVSQVVRAGSFSRNFHGIAEINDSSDVLRTFMSTQFRTPWTLPIVLVATPVSP
jgi:hypothetical protein